MEIGAALACAVGDVAVATRTVMAILRKGYCARRLSFRVRNAP